MLRLYSSSLVLVSSDEKLLKSARPWPFIWRRIALGQEVTLPAELTLASVYMRQKLTPLPESTLLVYVLIVSP